MKKLYIDLDGGKKLNLGTLESFDSKAFRLRTVDKNQYQARINLGLTDEIKSFALGSVYLERLKASSNGYSYLDCQVKKESRRLFLTIKNGGRTVCREDFSLLPRRTLYAYIVWSLAGLLLLGGLLFFLLTFDFSSMGAGSTVSQGQTTARQTSVDPGEGDATAGSPVPDAPAQTDREESSNAGGQSLSAGEDRAVTPPDRAERETAASAPEAESASQAAEGTDRGETPEPASATEPDLSILDREDLVVYFTPNSAELSAKTRESLRNVLAFLLDYPSLRVTITGHCAIAGTEAGRKEISDTRAENVEKWLRREGWSPENPPKVTGAAGNFPVTRDPDRQEINRRVEIGLSEN